MAGPVEPDDYVRIGVLARALNRSPVTLRRWERLGLLPPPRRRSVSISIRGERRLYASQEVEALRRAALHSGILSLEDNKADYPAFARLARQALHGERE